MQRLDKVIESGSSSKKKSPAAPVYVMAKNKRFEEGSDGGMSMKKRGSGDRTSMKGYEEMS
jgi:hypothetical protein